jgi:hypothetical protein
MGKPEMNLVTIPNLPDHDKTYESLIKAHRGLNKEESNARLILILKNHIGDETVLA